MQRNYDNDGDEVKAKAKVDVNVGVEIEIEVEVEVEVDVEVDVEAGAGVEVEVVVAGHVCLDIIPSITNRQDKENICLPGRLVEVGSALLSTGGAVSNTGVALHRLGVKVKLMGKVGDDLFGSKILSILAEHGEHLADRMIVAEGECSSYSIVLEPPGADRMFLHCKGTNDTFTTSDINFDDLLGARLFHYGYPPLMQNMYKNDGEALTSMFQQIKAMGIMTSLDMAMPDPNSEAGHIDWRSLLQNVLPHVDLFLPSLDEILYMLQRERFERLQAVVQNDNLVAAVDGYLLHSLSEELLQMGVAVVVLKLGEHGLYMRTTSNKLRLQAIGGSLPEHLWLNRELLVPSYDVHIEGTTGAGDCTIAGFIAGVLKNLKPEDILLRAAGTGAHNVEKADATSGVVSWQALESRIRGGWNQYPVQMSLQGWYPHSSGTYWLGPSDHHT